MKVMICESDQDKAKVIEDLLNVYKFKVITLTDGMNFVKKVQSCKPAVIIMNEKFTKKPGDILKRLEKEFCIPSELVRHDTEKGRIEVAAWILEDLPALFNCKYFIVEEYPTADRLEVEKRPLN